MARIERPQSRRRGSKPRAINEVLEGLLKDLGLLARAKEELAALHWRDVVGDFMARHTTVEGARQGTLRVRADNAAIAQELQLMQVDIVSRLNKALGGNYIKRIKAQAGSSYRRRPTAAPPEPPGPSGPSPEELERIVLPEVERELIAQIAAEAGGSDLTERLERVLTHEARIRRWRERQGLRTCEHCGAGYDPKQGCAVCAAIRRRPLT